MPRLWSDTIDAHRRAVGEAILDATAALVAEHGPASVSMSQIAEAAGIGRATLYKYFPDVDAILVAWHERQIRNHLQQLAQVADQSGDADSRLHAVLLAYALICHHHHGTELAAMLHRGEHVARARRQLTAFVADLLAQGRTSGHVRTDVAPAELAAFCLSALGAASDAPSTAAVRRLVAVTQAGLRPPA